jgi:hypothetical protein
MSGWIKIHRKILEWEWYDDSNTFRLFMHLILKANHKDKKYRGIVVKTGSLLTGRELLSMETGLSIQQVRTCLERLKSTNEITINSSKQGTVIQIVKYKDYQITTNDLTTNQPQDNHQVTTNKNVKNEKEVLIDEWIAYRRSIKKVLTEASINKLLKEIESYSTEKCRFVINASISNGWQGLFWDKYDNQTKQPLSIDPLVERAKKLQEQYGIK